MRTGIVFGLLPAMRASRPDQWATLKDTVGAVAGIDRVHPGRPDGDPHLARTRHRIGHLSEPQPLRSAELGHDHCLHGTLPAPRHPAAPGPGIMWP